jgi:hypothetical protein
MNIWSKEGRMRNTLYSQSSSNFQKQKISSNTLRNMMVKIFIFNTLEQILVISKMFMNGSESEISGWKALGTVAGHC